MNSTDGSTPHLPSIVRTVLCQGTRARTAGMVSRETFDMQLARITKEELSPRGLILLERELADGRTRFLIKNAVTHAVCDMIEWPEAPAEHVDVTPEEALAVSQAFAS